MSARFMSLLFLFLILITFTGCQNPGRFQAPQIAHFCAGQC